jgi:hypothetical protein
MSFLPELMLAALGETLTKVNARPGAGYPSCQLNLETDALEADPK